MSTAPYGFRLLVGAATIAVEETLKLPKTIMMYPMTLASQTAQLVMSMQQNLAEMAIKGDSTLESIFPPKDEQPEWATFDDDLPDDSPAASPVGSSVGDTATDGERRTEGRFALYSTTDTPPETPKAPKAPKAPKSEAPAVVAKLKYPTLTLAQLRARLTSLSLDDLTDLLAYEESTAARAPFQTLLANRITRVSAK